MKSLTARTVFALCTLCLTAVACQVPVFRFALERWEADDYRIVIYEKGERTASTAALMERLQQASRHSDSSEGTTGNANIVIEIADINNLTDAQQWSLLNWESIDSFPALQIYYPDSTGIDQPLWQGDLNAAAVEKLLNSPARQELTKRLTAGDSAVWVLLESGDPTADATAMEKLKGCLLTAESTLEIPEGVIRPEELANTINTRETPVEMDDVLRSRIPLKIAFSVMPLNSNDPDEEIFARMMTQANGRDLNSREPQAIPVFGRGRMMPGIPASRISDSSIGSAAGYLCGACSCQVKEQNPGLDLLVGTDWSKHLQDGLIVTERELPPLSGAGDIAATSEITEEIDQAGTSSPLALTLSIALAAVILTTLAGSVYMLRK